MSFVLKHTRTGINDLGNDRQVTRFVGDVTPQELLEEFHRPDWECYEKQNSFGLFRGVIFSIPFSLLCWWLIYQLFFS